MVVYKLLLPPNLLSSFPDVPSGMTTVCCPMESSPARPWEIEAPEKMDKTLLTLLLLITGTQVILADLTRTLLVSISVSHGVF